MKSALTTFIIFLIVFVSPGQPNGNGNGGNGNNGNGNGGCANPPCGGPNSVPLNAEWLVVAGLLVGSYIKFSKRRKE